MNEESKPNSNFSDNPETKKVVTPFAFQVADELVGCALAGPGRRLGAITIDLICVGLLTTISSLFLAIGLLVVCGKSWLTLRNEAGKSGLKLTLVVLMLISVMVIGVHLAFSSLSNGGSVSISNESVEVIENAEESLRYQNSKVSDEFELVVSELRNSKGHVYCDVDEQCDDAFFGGLTQHLIEQKYSYSDASLIFNGVRELLDDNDRLDGDAKSLTLSETIYTERYSKEHAFFGTDDKGNSLVGWLQGLVSDLGLSFGWAAIYFSVLTAWWNGQTLGKRMLGIRVVRIDGKRIDLWESLGRYGGYSAGLATGLLGFLQIYWDANRQAIQDKISETFVIKI